MSDDSNDSSLAKKMRTDVLMDLPKCIEDKRPVRLIGRTETYSKLGVNPHWFKVDQPKQETSQLAQSLRTMGAITHLSEIPVGEIVKHIVLAAENELGLHFLWSSGKTDVPTSVLESLCQLEMVDVFATLKEKILEVVTKAAEKVAPKDGEPQYIQVERSVYKNISTEILAKSDRKVSEDLDYVIVEKHELVNPIVESVKEILSRLEPAKSYLLERDEDNCRAGVVRKHIKSPFSN